MNSISVYSPLKGELKDLGSVPDGAFAKGLLGVGMAVEPQENIVRAPIEGRVRMINKFNHAVVLERAGVEILVQIGLNAPELNGEGFKMLIKKGDQLRVGEPMIEFDRFFISQKLKSNLVFVVAANSRGALFIPEAQKEVAPCELIFELGAPDEASLQDKTITLPPQDIVFTSEKIEVLNPSGLHARPAALIANRASQSGLPISIIKNGIAVSAKSLVALMGLNIHKGDFVRLSAYGPGAEQEVAAVAALINEINNARPAIVTQNEDFTLGLNMNAEQPVPVHTIYRGKVMAPVFVLKHIETDFDEDAPDASAEMEHYKKCLAEFENTLKEDIKQTDSTESKNIIEAHLAILKDPYINEITALYISKGKSAAYAFSKAIEDSINVLQRTKNQLIMERVNDLTDIRKNLVNKFIGREVDVNIPPGSVVAAEDLFPSEIKELEGRAAGVILARGSHTSHTAIMLKNLGLPTVYGAGMGIMNIPNGRNVIIDADRMFIVINPSEATVESFEISSRQATERRKQFLEQAALSAMTLDGRQIFVRGNIGGADQSAAAKTNGAEGVGLVRTEFMFLNKTEPPAEEEQSAMYQKIADDMFPYPVTFRTLDIGGDKPALYIKIPKEQNPLLGIRGVRVYEENEDVFRTQIRALLKVKPLSSVRIMLPMVAFVEEIARAKKIINEEKMALGISENVQTGVMLEVPGACLMTGKFAEHADFFSIGTNDLTQYTLAIDREHPQMSDKAQAMHPAVLRLISLAAAGAAASERQISVCGALASEENAIPILIGLGIEEFAVVTGEVAQIKALIRTLDSKRCVAVAARAMNLDTAEEVEELVKKEFGV